MRLFQVFKKKLINIRGTEWPRPSRPFTMPEIIAPQRTIEHRELPEQLDGKVFGLGNSGGAC